MEEIGRQRVGQYALGRGRAKGKLGALVRRARVAKDMSQEEVAERLGTNVSTFSRIENGQRQVGEATIRRLSEILDVPIDDLHVAAGALPSDVERWILEVPDRLRRIRHEMRSRARRSDKG